MYITPLAAYDILPLRYVNILCMFAASRHIGFLVFCSLLT